MNNRVRGAALALVALLLLSAPAGAQLFRAYVSTAGSDLNPCTLASPCRLLPAALTAVADGGEIWMLNSANYNTGQVEITKSVTILAIPGAVGSVVATGGGHAINIDTAGVKVTLRNLVIVHLTSSADGIHFAQGAALLIEDCEIANVSGNGIFASAPGAKVTVRETVVRSAGNAGVSLAGSPAVLGGVRITGGAGTGVVIGGNANVTVSGSVIAGNHDGMVIFTTSGDGASRLAVTRSLVSRNVRFGIATFPLGGAPVAIDVIVTDTTIDGSAMAGIRLGGSASPPTTTLYLERTTITGPGISVSGGVPVAYTRGNNNISSVSGVTLTALAAQ